MPFGMVGVVARAQALGAFLVIFPSWAAAGAVAMMVVFVLVAHPVLAATAAQAAQQA
jgi:hypothetical protein